MDTHPLQFGDLNNSDVKLQIICPDGNLYEGNPLFLHCNVLKKSKFFEARLSERWSSSTSLPEIQLTVPPNGSAEHYIKCIRLMYSSYSASDLRLSNVDETLDILSVASELLFDEGILACMRYLEAVPWTTTQKLKIKALLFSLQVNISPDLSARLRNPVLSFHGELELLKKRLTEMLSEILPEMFPVTRNRKREFVARVLPLGHMRNKIKQYVFAIFEGNAPQAIKDVCREALLNDCRIKIEGIKFGNSMETRACACEAFSWLLDMIKLCNDEIYEAAFKMFVEDAQLPNILLKPQTNRAYFCHMLDILLDRFLKGLANGDIITSKSLRISFLATWVPVMAYVISRLCSLYSNDRCILGGKYLTYCSTFEEEVPNVLGSIPPDDQKYVFEVCAETCDKFESMERETSRWWINVMWMAVMASNFSHVQIK